LHNRTNSRPQQHLLGGESAVEGDHIREPLTAAGTGMLFP